MTQGEEKVKEEEQTCRQAKGIGVLSEGDAGGESHMGKGSCTRRKAFQHADMGNDRESGGVCVCVQAVVAGPAS